MKNYEKMVSKRRLLVLGGKTHCKDSHVDKPHENSCSRPTKLRSAERSYTCDNMGSYTGTSKGRRLAMVYDSGSVMTCGALASMAVRFADEEEAEASC